MLLPPLFVERMKERLGPEYPAFEEALQQPPLVSVRYHPAKPGSATPDAMPVPWHPEGRYLPERPSFTLDPAFHGGAYYVQEASSMFLYEALRQTVDLSKSLRVLDLCASPGGKSTLLLSAVSPESWVMANEAIRSRVGALGQNLVKWGYPNMAVANHDPADFAGLEGFFDVVLVDAPCSGEGLFRKDSAAISEWSPQNLALCSARQQRILQTAKTLVKTGGLLVYSTCTFNPDENERRVDELLADGSLAFVPLALDPAWGIAGVGSGYQFYPHKARGEGFFLACMKKVGGEASISPAKGKAAFKSWRRLGTKELAMLEGWIKNPDRFVFFEKPDGNLTAMPVQHLEDFGRLASILARRAFGFHVGTFKNKDLIPSHELALSLAVEPGFPSVELDLEAALQFLRKENLKAPVALKGWHLSRFHGIPLGWMKVLDNRINNYLPTEWRIRMR